MPTRKRSTRAKASIMMFNGKWYKATPLNKTELKQAKSEFENAWPVKWAVHD